MTVIFTDENGDPVFSETGQMLQITGTTELRHRIMNLFNTSRGSEPFFIEYGFDYQMLHQNIELEPKLKLYTCINDALNPDYIKGMYALHSVIVDIDGSTGYTSFVIIDEKEDALEINTAMEMNV